MYDIPISDLTSGCAFHRNLQAGNRVYTDASDIMSTDVGVYDGFWYMRTSCLLNKEASFKGVVAVDVVLLVPSFGGKRRVRRCVKRDGWRPIDEKVNSTICSLWVFRRRVTTRERVSMRGVDRIYRVGLVGFTFLVRDAFG